MNSHKWSKTMEQSSSASEQLPKLFERSSEILPITRHGMSTFSDFKKSEECLQNVEWLRRSGLSQDEIELYQGNEAGREKQRQIEASVLRNRLQIICPKISSRVDSESTSQDEQANTSTNFVETWQNVPTKTYPEGHPMNDINELEQKLFSRLKPQQQISPINKRCKLLRRLERKEKRLLAQDEPGPCFLKNTDTDKRPGSLWDIKEIPLKKRPVRDKETVKNEKFIGPKKPTMYTVKDGKIVRLEPVENDTIDVYQAVDIVIPVNAAERRLLEGTKISVEDIKNIERFKDYEPGVTSKVLYLKNIASSVSEEQLQLLFKPFVQDNGGPINLRLMSGGMRGQAFVAFENEDVSIRALDEVNGTIMGGRPIIVQFGRNRK